jgi:hypothetical protein
MLADEALSDCGMIRGLSLPGAMANCTYREGPTSDLGLMGCLFVYMDSHVEIALDRNSETENFAAIYRLPA